MQSRIYIIGLGVEGRDSLSQKTLQLIQSAGLIIGGERHLQEFPEFKGERFVLKSNLKEMLELINSFAGNAVDFKDNAPAFGTPSLLKRGLGGVVVLASGDPGLFGIADYLIRNLGRDAVEIIPNVSAMQWAFAKAKVSWNDARIVSSHGRGMDKVLEAAREADKVGIFTSDGKEPSSIAKLLIDNGLSCFTAYVCEDLGMETEKISEMPLSGAVGKSFAALNVMVLVRNNPPASPLKLRGDQRGGIGLPDSEFARTGNLITREEVRVVSLAKLGLRDDSVVWDIGAGSGSVGIEAARLCRNGKVFAIEKEAERVANIRDNIKKFGVNNLEVAEGKAPKGLENFADPDAVFIGGSGGNISDILDVVETRLKPSGRIVVNAITLETLHDATTGLRSRGFDVDVVSLNIARSKDLIGMKMFEAENPVFIIVGRRGDPCDRPI